ncbi:hypothetical protein C4552_03605 [Candidatus Parcubacteria bacterium]|nr:MAG: hypothetical protein C4552_03605 [Candidatus Parcubacteria bacterium]
MPPDQQPASQNRWYRILAIAAGFAVVLIFGAWLAVRMISDGGEAPRDLDESEVSIIPSDSRPIRYDTAGFHPTELTVKITDSLGCLISIQNATSKPITIRVGPHNEDGEDPGSQYPDIAPGEAEIFDIRYPGLDGVTLHDHDNPDHEIAITYGEGCK